ncbi:hypothetical protein [Limnobacter parvus]|uniref:Uncharacterized protein n=1 Tax=Limnobacter parvus TaxID=2939690 RepID=A0ABT1XJX8_9BURK|nr:hypothetical protein [Limnobacter parvus]MCR2747159.1 hypothetical protein [Limnobacter parvus]
MDKTLLLRAIALGQDALLALNGMILGKLNAGQEVRMPVHEFIQAGENRLQVFSLEELPDGEGSVLAKSDCSVQVWVELQKDRGSATQVEPHILFALEESFNRGQRIHKARMLDVQLDLPVSFPRWRYLDVLQSTPTESDRIKIQDFVLNMQGLFRGRKVSALSPYFTHRNREIATAYGLDLQQAHSNFTKYLNQLCMNSTLEDSMQDPQAWLFYTVRNSAVYALLNMQHQALFQFQCVEDNTTIHLPMHVGVLGGEVFVLR